MRGPRLGALIDGQRGALFPWVPVFLGAGIGIYFALPAEPSPALQGMLAMAAVALLLLGLRLAAGPPLIAVALLCAGVDLAAVRGAMVTAPVLTFRYYGAVEGRIVEIDRSSRDALRLTLDRVLLDNVPPFRTPDRVRVSLYGPDGVVPEPGMRVMTTANLSPPEGPVAPGAFDFRRQAWFDRLGAVGYTRAPVLLVDPAPRGPDLLFARLRMRLSAAIQARLPGQPGAFAATILTGDRSGLSLGTANDLRAANLSHLLSISGLHMVLLCGTVLGAVRLALSLVPPLALRWPVRKIAAFAALLAGLFYYLLAGRDVPAERAWVMIAVVFGAVLVDRRAISLRSVALAATVVLLMRPEALVTPGFQMSFAATLALVAAFAALRGRAVMRGWIAPAVTLLLSSAVAGAATAPFAAAHFNRIADYGLIANLMTVPLMGLVVMPAGVAAAVLGLAGLDWIAFAVMEWPIRWILDVAHRVAAMPGAVTPVLAPGHWVLPLIAAGGLILALWQGRWLRLAGLAPLLLGLALWGSAQRPALLVSADGGLLGLMTPAGRALSKATGQGFAAQSWLEDDGDPVDQERAAARDGLTRDKGQVLARVGRLRVAQIFGRGASDRIAAACTQADLVVTTVAAPAGLPRGCVPYDPVRLRRTGALAIWLGDGEPRIQTVAESQGSHPWVPVARKPRSSVPPAGGVRAVAEAGSGIAAPKTGGRRPPLPVARRTRSPAPPAGSSDDGADGGGKRVRVADDLHRQPTVPAMRRPRPSKPKAADSPDPPALAGGAPGPVRTASVPRDQ